MNSLDEKDLNKVVNYMENKSDFKMFDLTL
jgi:hypothetical protein